MKEENVKKMYKFLEDLESGSLEIVIEQYPERLEDVIQTAVSYKRKGDYDSAISTYFLLFESEKNANCDILVYFYKVLIASCDFYAAYRIICAAEKEVIKQKGEYSTLMSPWGTPMGFVPWLQSDHKNRLLEAMHDAAKGNTTALREYCKAASGNPKYECPLTDGRIKFIAWNYF